MIAEYAPRTASTVTQLIMVVAEYLPPKQFELLFFN